MNPLTWPGLGRAAGALAITETDVLLELGDCHRADDGSSWPREWGQGWRGTTTFAACLDFSTWLIATPGGLRRKYMENIFFGIDDDSPGQVGPGENAQSRSCSAGLVDGNRGGGLERINYSPCAVDANRWLPFLRIDTGG